MSATPTPTSTVVAHPPPTEPPPSVPATPSGITATVLAVTEAPAEAVEVDMELPYFDRGESVLFSVQGLPSGTYTYWCNVDKHYEYGMVGTLTITE